MGFRIFKIFLIICCISCNNVQDEKSEKMKTEAKEEIKFDKARWGMMDRGEYPYREEMLHDLVYNDTIRTLEKVEIINLLGKPDRTNENHLYYTISLKKLGFWTMHAKTLVIKISENNGIEWIKIHE